MINMQNYIKLIFLFFIISSGRLGAQEKHWTESRSGVIHHDNKVVIGSATPNQSAILNITSSDKGFSFPSVALTGSQDQTTILNPAIGLVVYNTGEDINFNIKDLLYWNGDNWIQLSNAPAISGKFTVNPTNLYATIFPNTYKSGVYFEGILSVTYVGGTVVVGEYNNGTPYTVDGLTYTLQTGKTLTNSGQIIYKVSGIPNVNSSSSSINNIPIKFENSQFAPSDINIGTISVGGPTQGHKVVQYELINDSKNTQSSNAPIGDGTMLSWRRSGGAESLILPESGSYVLSFRLYGERSISYSVNSYYLSCWVNSTMQDIKEIIYM